MMLFYKLNKNKIEQKSLVHGNLTPSCIICNNYDFKFINLENAFVGSYFFDLCNLVFELQMSGLKEYDFITKKIN
jgi:5-methylthioribose kinase